MQRYFLTDDSIQRKIVQQVRAAVLEGIGLDSWMAALISLVQASHLTDAMFRPEERPEARPLRYLRSSARIKAIAEGELVANRVGTAHKTLKLNYNTFIRRSPMNRKILVTGATGSNGTEIIKRLSAQNIQVRAMVRNPDRAKEIALPNVEVVEGNFDRPETLLEALTEVDSAFLLTNSTEHAEAQQLAFVDAARQSGVKHIVKLSQFAADAHSPVRFLRYHAAVEAAIQASGMTYTFLRPNLFMQGLLNFRSTITSQNAFYAAIGDAKVSVVDVRDIADVAVAALTEAEHEGKIYDLTGPQALTHTEMAEYLSAALKRQIAFVDIPPDQMREAMVGFGMPAWQADGLIEDYAHYRRNEAAAIASGIEDATGQAPRSFKTFACDYATIFGWTQPNQPAVPKRT